MDIFAPTAVGFLALLGMTLGFFFLMTLTTIVAKRTEGGGGTFVMNFIALLVSTFFLGIIWMVSYSLGRFISG